MQLQSIIEIEAHSNGLKTECQPVRDEYEAVKKAIGFGDVASCEYPFLKVNLAVAYIENGSAIHAWFSRRPLFRKATESKENKYFFAPLNKEDFSELYFLCQKTIKLKDATILPPMEGEEYAEINYTDERYFSYIESFAKQISPLLENKRLGFPSYTGVYYSPESTYCAIKNALKGKK